jgi:hypothetical protein
MVTTCFAGLIVSLADIRHYLKQVGLTVPYDRAGCELDFFALAIHYV